jgi:beta-phosphoglucomutase-like phosphatase (HAD superfamily)
LIVRVREAGMKVAVASSAKKQDLNVYLDLAGISALLDASTSSDDAEASKPAPDIFNAVLKKLDVAGADAIAVGDSPYDAQAARAAGMGCIGFLSGGFTESSLRDAGCHAIYPGPGAMLACFNLAGPSSNLADRPPEPPSERV